MQKRVKLQLEEWSKVEDVNKLASVYFEVTHGNRAELDENIGYENWSSVWGRVAATVFEKNTELHRHFLRNIWVDNRKGIQVNITVLQLNFHNLVI